MTRPSIPASTPPSEVLALPRNRLLAALPPQELDRLAPLLRRDALAVKDVIIDYDRPIERVYFPEDAVISLLGLAPDGSAVETATIGNEGVVGLPVFLGVDRISAQAFCQLPGDALSLDSATFRAEAARGGDLASLLGRYAVALFTLVAQSSACNRLHTTRERCARWLLMTHDRRGRDDIPLTQQFLSQMLGVRRATITEVAGSFQEEGLIEYAYGRVRVRDRAGLEAASCACYALVTREYARLLEGRELPDPLAGTRFTERGKSAVRDGAP
jgi:CRP-like cAMP-binding protein